MAFTQSDFENVLRVVGDIKRGRLPRCRWPTIPCPDQAMSFGTWGVMKGPSIKRRTGQRAAIVVIESPHKEEFKPLSPGRWMAVGPLQKRERFKDHFRKHAGTHLVGFPPNSLVILLNAVRFQCSLGRNSRNHPLNTQRRDARFRECWRQGARGDFIDRLIGIYRDGDVIINACTGTKFGVRNRQTGLVTDDLKWLVEDAIMAAVPKHRQPTVYHCPTRKKAQRLRICDVGTHHPSVWKGKRSEVLWS